MDTSFPILRVVILVILLCSQARVSAAENRSSVILFQGEPGDISVYDVWTPDPNHAVLARCSIAYGKSRYAFYSDNQFNAKGLKDYGQIERFSVSKEETNNSLSISLSIQDVQFEDAGTFVFEYFVYIPRYPVIGRSIQIVKVQSPKASCFVEQSNHSRDHFEITCNAPSRKNFQISCFQGNKGLLHMGDTADNGYRIRRSFWISASRYRTVYCCSHDKKNTITQKSCRDFEWPQDVKNYHTRLRPTTGNDNITNEISGLIISNSCNNRHVSWTYHAIIVFTVLYICYHV